MSWGVNPPGRAAGHRLGHARHRHQPRRFGAAARRPGARRHAAGGAQDAELLDARHAHRRAEPAGPAALPRPDARHEQRRRRGRLDRLRAALPARLPLRTSPTRGDPDRRLAALGRAAGGWWSFSGNLAGASPGFGVKTLPEILAAAPDATHRAGEHDPAGRPARRDRRAQRPRPPRRQRRRALDRHGHRRHDLRLRARHAAAGEQQPRAAAGLRQRRRRRLRRSAPGARASSSARSSTPRTAR